MLMGLSQELTVHGRKPIVLYSSVFRSDRLLQVSVADSWYLLSKNQNLSQIRASQQLDAGEVAGPVQRREAVTIVQSEYDTTS
jgi:hypothetical protein